MSHSSRRGMSLVEGMISMGVLVIGILGALQGILFASQQNAVAGRLARATSMAAQIRLGLEAQGRTKLLSATGPIGGSCTAVGSASAALKALTDGLDASTLTGACILDVDALDLPNSASPSNASKLLVGGYNFTENFRGDKGPFRRVVVFLPTGTVDTFAVVVSTPDTGRRVFVKQFVALYNSAATVPGCTTNCGNGSGVDL